MQKTQVSLTVTCIRLKLEQRRLPPPQQRGPLCGWHRRGMAQQAVLEQSDDALDCVDRLASALRIRLDQGAAEMNEIEFAMTSRISHVSSSLRVLYSLCDWPSKSATGDSTNHTMSRGLILCETSKAAGGHDNSYPSVNSTLLKATLQIPLLGSLSTSGYPKCVLLNAVPPYDASGGFCLATGPALCTRTKFTRYLQHDSADMAEFECEAAADAETAWPPAAAKAISEAGQCCIQAVGAMGAGFPAESPMPAFPTGMPSGVPARSSAHDPPLVDPHDVSGRDILEPCFGSFPSHSKGGEPSSEAGGVPRARIATCFVYIPSDGTPNPLFGVDMVKTELSQEQYILDLMQFECDFVQSLCSRELGKQADARGDHFMCIGLGDEQRGAFSLRNHLVGMQLATGDAISSLSKH